MIFKADIKTIFPVTNLEESYSNGLDKLISDFKEQSGKILLPIKHFGNTAIKMKFSEKSGSKSFSESDYSLFLIVEATIDLDCFKIAKEGKMKVTGEKEIPIELKNKLKELKLDDVTKFNELPAAFMVPAAYQLFFSQYLKYFLNTTQIAYPGTLWLADGIISINDSKPDKIEGFSSIFYEYDFQNHKWPKFIELNTKEVWDYIINKTKVLTDFSNSKIERAINSFSYIFSKHPNYLVPISLFWSISGLESIFVTGEIGITEQLNEKIQVFLGIIEYDKKQLKKLYSFRSKLIHGSLNIPINSTLFDDEKYDDEIYQMSGFAAVILTACLQKIIKNQMTELNFRYEYK